MTAPYAWLPMAGALAGLLCILASLAATGLLRNVRACFRARKARREPASMQEVDMFLNKILFKGETENIRFVSFCIDVFLFDFRPWYPDGLDRKAQYAFFDYMRTLDLRDMRAVTKLYIWLIQHDVKTDLKFQWNRDLPVKYNLSRRKYPKKIRDNVDSYGRDAILAYDLSKDPYALHP